jgi:L-ascorbate metabolism protein UlaG (beta-lactamase superfamily)
MGPAEAMMAAQFIGAKLVIPIHYNTWDKIEQDPAPWKEAIERTTDIRVKILKPGEKVEVKPAS